MTIVTNNREHKFGVIENLEMNYSVLGNFCLENIQRFTPLLDQEFPHQNNPHVILKKDYLISIDDWVIMPNHIHLLIEIQSAQDKEQMLITGLAPLRKGSISSFVNKFKGIITKYAHENNLEFKWQARFHDRIVRNEDEYFAIKTYIQNNIKNWANDKENN